ncbi:heavy metal-binding domain-containing protein [Flavobacterium aquicola]|uniref:Heavy metal binding domain-containing protein n=1 Tax=Flavobacterium aquicola TaxID=1682742 RepID=A0A3E0ER90_9FLAO|nr:heavy metal-binding domain-containing protein [Flavobacterium aquicola]REH00251.1 hypothetical protein C8P67_103227 [Flavobacterium aquicola]
MKTVFIILTVFFAMGNIVAQTTASPKKEVQKTMYTCPMHPKVISDKKGECSKCGMDLVPVKGKAPVAKKSKYFCTMDDSTSEKPGKCPKCGMAMIERKPEKK